MDDARSHLGTIKILRNFHYIDEAGKDQGLNGECQLASNGKVHKCSFEVCSKTDATYSPNAMRSVQSVTELKSLLNCFLMSSVFEWSAARLERTEQNIRAPATQTSFQARAADVMEALAATASMQEL